MRLRAPGARRARRSPTGSCTAPTGCEILDTVAKLPVTDKEAVFVAFPFALDAPRARYEITGGVHADGDPRCPGSAHHMRAVRGWVALEGERTVALGTYDAPLVQVGTIHLPYAPFPPTTHAEPATVFSWAMNNGWDTNFPLSQGGEVELAYAVADRRPARARRRRRSSACSPRPRGSGALPERGRLCALPDGVELIAIGASRDGDGLGRPGALARGRRRSSSRSRSPTSR